MSKWVVLWTGRFNVATHRQCQWLANQALRKPGLAYQALNKPNQGIRKPGDLSILVNFPRRWERDGAERAFGPIQFPELDLELETKRTARPLDRPMIPPGTVRLGLLDLQYIFPGRVQAAIEPRRLEIDAQTGRIWIASPQVLGSTTDAVESALRHSGLGVITWRNGMAQCSVCS